MANFEAKKVPSTLLKRSNFTSKEFEIKQDIIPKSRIKEGFDPIVYKFLTKVGYDFKESVVLNISPSQVTSGMIHELNPTQKMLKEKEYAIENLKFGLDYSSLAPIRIKINRVSSQYIAVEDESSQITDKF